MSASLDSPCLLAEVDATTGACTVPGEYARWFVDKVVRFDERCGLYFLANQRAYSVANEIWTLATAEGKQTGDAHAPPLPAVLSFCRANCSPGIRQYCEGAAGCTKRGRREAE